MVRCQNRTESYIAGSMYFFTTCYINKTESLYEVTYLPRKVSAPNKPRSQYVVSFGPFALSLLSEERYWKRGLLAWVMSQGPLVHYNAKKTKFKDVTISAGIFTYHSRLWKWAAFESQWSSSKERMLLNRL